MTRRNNEYRAYTSEPERDGTLSNSMEKLVLETCAWADFKAPMKLKQVEELGLNESTS